MILTKLEPPNLDLPNSRYGFYKIALKSEQMNYLPENESLTAGTHRSAGKHASETQKQSMAWDGAESTELVGGDFFGDSTGATSFPTTSRTH